MSDMTPKRYSLAATLGLLAAGIVSGVFWDLLLSHTAAGRSLAGNDLPGPAPCIVLAIGWMAVMRRPRKQ